MQKLIDKFLNKYREKPVSIYGTGLNAERVLENVKGYSFSCVISNDESLIGTQFGGKEVVALEEAIKISDIILIAAIPSATRIVYERIKDDVPDDIMVFDLSGNQLNAPEQYRNCDYWKVRYEDLIEAIDAHDVISFDLFDTILMRKCLYPDTVLKITEVILPIQQEDCISDFYVKRTNAEKNLYSERKHPTLYEIYERMGSDYKISERSLARAAEREIATEYKLMSRREEIYEAYQYALKNKKKIFLTSDMYLTKEIINLILSEQGIDEYQDLLVSCEAGCDKESGKLFDILKEKAGSGNVLHIGDNETSDIGGAGLAGIDAFHICSGLDILLNSSAADVVSKTGNVWDELLLGQILVSLRMFNSPFELGRHKGKLCIETVQDMAKLCFVPITIGYVSWIVGQLKGKKEDIVLFVSRDGYLLEQIYRDIRDNNPNLELPQAVYFYTSRKVMADVIPVNRQGIETLCFNLDQYRKIDIVKHIEKVFGVTFSGDVCRYSEKHFDEIDKDELLKALYSEQDTIFDHAKYCREKYIKYIEKLDLNSYRNIYIVDLVAQGSTRFGLSSLVGKDVTLLSLATTTIPNAFVKDPLLARSMYGQVVTGVGGAVSKMFPLLELVYGSRDGQVMGFDDNGRPIFSDTTKYNASLLDTIQDEILCYLKGYSDMEWYLHGCTPQFAESMLAILDSEYSDVTDTVRNFFDFYDPLDEIMDKYNVLSNVRGE